MSLSDVIQANQRFLESNGHLEELQDGAGRKTAIVTCMDGRLTGMVENAMGYNRGEAATIRVAGNTMAESDDLFRSLALAVYVLGVEEIFVVGHTDCGLAKIKAFDFTEAMRSKGVSRDAIESISLRDWLGAFHDVDENVRKTIHNIRRSGILPVDMPVYGLVIETETGKLRTVEDSV